MLNITLNIVGIVLVLYSIFIIKKDISKKKDNLDNLIDNDLFKEEIDHYQVNGETIEDFDLLIEKKIKSSDLEEKEIKEQTKSFETYKKPIPIIKDNRINSNDDKINPLHKKVMELAAIGLSNEEIAKKMGKGIREIDIILKICKKHL